MRLCAVRRPRQAPPASKEGSSSGARPRCARPRAPAAAPRHLHGWTPSTRAARRARQRTSAGVLALSDNPLIWQVPRVSVRARLAASQLATRLWRCRDHTRDEAGDLRRPRRCWLAREPRWPPPPPGGSESAIRSRPPVPRARPAVPRAFAWRAVLEPRAAEAAYSAWLASVSARGGPSGRQRHHMPLRRTRRRASAGGCGTSASDGEAARGAVGMGSASSTPGRVAAERRHTRQHACRRRCPASRAVREASLCSC